MSRPHYVVDDIAVSADGRVVTLHYDRAPEPDEEMDARDWLDIRSRYRALAREQLARGVACVAIFASAPDCQDWQIDEVTD